MSIGIASNFYREMRTLPSFLKMATSGYFDDVVMIHSPPEGAKPDDDSIDLVKAAGVRLVHTTINRGFGAVRTRCIRESRAEWVFILDCDERFLLSVPQIKCHGTEGYPQFKNPRLDIEVIGEVIDQGARLKSVLQNEMNGRDAVAMSRRHWLCDPSSGLDRPCQNWTLINDLQLRLVRNSPFLFYDRKLHEHLKDTRTWNTPATSVYGDLFIEHYHHWAKDNNARLRKESIRTYEMLDAAGTRDMWTKTGWEESK